MRLMAYLLLEHVDKGCCIGIIDGILIYSKNEEDHDGSYGHNLQGRLSAP